MRRRRRAIVIRPVPVSNTVIADMLFSGRVNGCPGQIHKKKNAFENEPLPETQTARGKREKNRTEKIIIRQYENINTVIFSSLPDSAI